MRMIRTRMGVFWERNNLKEIFLQPRLMINPCLIAMKFSPMIDYRLRFVRM